MSYLKSVGPVELTFTEAEALLVEIIKVRWERGEIFLSTKAEVGVEPGTKLPFMFHTNSQKHAKFLDLDLTVAACNLKMYDRVP